MCEHEKSTLLLLVQSQAYHTRLITAAPPEEEKKKAHRGHAGTFILTRTETMGSLKTEQVG